MERIYTFDTEINALLFAHHTSRVSGVENVVLEPAVASGHGVRLTVNDDAEPTVYEHFKKLGAVIRHKIIDVKRPTMFPITDSSGDTSFMRLGYKCVKITIAHKEGGSSTLTYTCKPGTDPHNRFGPLKDYHQYTYTNMYGVKEEWCATSVFRTWSEKKFGVSLTNQFFMYIGIK